MTIGGDSFARNRLFFQYTGAGPTIADLNTLGGTINTAWNTNLRASFTTNVTLQSLVLTDLTSNTTPQTVVASGSAGTNANPIGPASLALIVKFKINRRYRGGHPRFYEMGVPPVNLATAQTWTAGTISSAATNFAAFIAACVLAPPASIGTLTHSNVSYFSGFTNKTFPSGRVHPVPTVRVTPVVDPIVSYSVNGKVGSQRRRDLQSP